MLSGIGDAAHLTSFGIPVVYNNPQVGMNLMDHTFLLQCYDAAHVLPSTNIYSAVHIFCSADGMCCCMCECCVNVVCEAKLHYLYYRNKERS
jgi:choline dehydrogenase-like flavoprotein